MKDSFLLKLLNAGVKCHEHAVTIKSKTDIVCALINAAKGNNPTANTSGLLAHHFADTANKIFDSISKP